MRLQMAVFVLSAMVLAGADKKVVPPARAGNDEVDLSGTAILTREDATRALGIDPGMDLIIVDIHVKPKSDAKIILSRDDFTMISRRDGQKTQAMHPSQIAGSGVMIVSSTAQGASGGMVGQRRGPIWGGMPGTGGRPRRMGGDNDVSSVSEAETRTQSGDTKDKDSALLAAMKQKELPQKEISEETSGLLYFVFEGKHKLKDFELLCKTKGGILTLDFEK